MYFCHEFFYELGDRLLVVEVEGTTLYNILLGKWENHGLDIVVSEDYEPAHLTPDEFDEIEEECYARSYEHCLG